MPKVGTDTILDTQVEIWADSSGSWQITMPPDEQDGRRGDVLGYGPTLEQATARARTEMNKRRIKLHIDFVDSEGKRGYATGIHVRTRKILTEIAGEKEHLDTYVTVFRPDMPQEEIDALVKIDEGIAKLQAAKREIIDEWKFDLGKAVKDAIEAAAKD